MAHWREDEIDELRAQVAALTKERDTVRTAARVFQDAKLDALDALAAERRRASRLRSRLARVLRVAIHPDMPEWIPGVWSSKVKRIPGVWSSKVKR